MSTYCNKECKRERRDKRIALAAAGIIGFLVVASALGLVNLPINTPPGATGQAVNFKVSTQIYGGSFATWGKISFWDTAANNYGGGDFSATTSGIVTTGPIATGYTYEMFFNGTSSWAPNSWFVSVPAVSGQSQPINYYASITSPGGGPFTIYPYASAFSLQLIDTSGGTLSGAVKTTSSSAGQMANDTTPTHSTAVPDMFSLTITVSTPYSALYPQYQNPAYPASGPVGGYFYMVTNSTNVYAYSGCTVISIWSGTTPWQAIVVPIPMVIAGATANTYATSFGVYWPTAQHPQVYAYLVFNTNLQQLTSAKSLTASAPNGYTLVSNTFLGSKDASHTYCLWTVP